MINQLAGYFNNLFHTFSTPRTYGSALEEYRVRNSPQNAGDIDRLARQYHLEQERKHSRLWK